jgi:hypothetical protein
MNFIKIFFLVLFFESCATTPISPQIARSVPKEKISKYAQKSHDSDSKIIMTRDSGFLGSANTYGFYINNEFIADLEPSEKVEIFLLAGEYLLGIGPCKSCILGNSVPTRNIETLLKDKQEKQFRMYTTTSEFGISPVSSMPMK